MYLEYVIEDVLLNVSSREYAPNGAAGLRQKYRLITKYFNTLAFIINQYDLSGQNHSNQIQEDLTHPHKLLRDRRIVRHTFYIRLILKRNKTENNNVS